MEEKVKTLVAELQDIVNKQTNNKYSEVDDAMTSLVDYVQEMTANKTGVESRLKVLEDMLFKRSEKKKLCKDNIQKIRKEMMVAPRTPSTSRTKQEKGNPSSTTSSKTSTSSQTLLNRKRFGNKTAPISTTPASKSNLAISAPSANANPSHGKKIAVKPFRNESAPNTTTIEAKRSEWTQTDETEELSGTIDQSEQEYPGEMADEVRFFEECLNGLKIMFSDDTKNPLEKIISTATSKIKKKVNTGNTYIMDVAGDIRRLQAENKYLRTALDGIFKNVLHGDDTTLKEIKTPKNIKDNQTILEVKANIKEVVQRLHEIKFDAENAVTERECLLSTLECLFNNVRDQSEGKAESNISTALDEIWSSIKKEDSSNQILTHAKLISNIQAEWKREAEYVSHLLEELNEPSTYDGKEDTQVNLKEPPIQKMGVSKKDRKKDHKKENDEPPRSKHVERLQRNFAIASNVLKNQMNAREAITEKQCLLLTLEKLVNHVLDLSNGKTDTDISSSLDEISSNIKKESTANQGLSHAKVIFSAQMEWKREAEYASHLLEELNKLATYDGKHDTQVSLKEPPVQTVHDSSKDGKKDNKKKSDEPSRSRHTERLQRDFSSASNVLTKQMNAEQAMKERECLLSTLQCLYNHARDLYDGKTDGDISSALGDIWSSIKKESTANQGLFQANEISSIQIKWKRDTEHLKGTKKVLQSIIDGLHKEADDLVKDETRTDASSPLYQVESSISRESSSHRSFVKASEIVHILLEWKRDVEYVSCLLEELTQVSHSSNNGDNHVVLSRPQNVETSLHFKTNDARSIGTSQNKQPQSVHNEKLMKNYANASLVLKQLNEKENLRMDLGKKTEQVEDLKERLQRMQADNTKIKNDADSLRTRLSEQAGALLTFDNPSIADLSDPNRPTKVSEKYSELYDNEWTDAFANLSKEYPSISEEQMIGSLYEMIVDGYQFCKDIRETQKWALEDTLFDPAGCMKSNQRTKRWETSKIFAKNLSDVAKQSSNVSSANIAKAFVMDKKTKDKYREMIKLCATYIQEFVQLCWFMLVQTPPLCLDLKTAQGHAFDTICYREYTKKGKKIAFVVWPALFLHENGPLLCKGVAQGQ
ncbi:hypothetical protein CHS0354_009704 [Potamilus streckersoni]|uniref:Mitochondria-eating protein C-terminal domain-containing protein n=1 Tax=Potamilus streckersoni TaxID=2493646 RepID=A0AAE0VLQ2_9BIVA|nr:hypothetical protein CHS0354_009704 [Potamilus streckersoni]